MKKNLIFSLVVFLLTANCFAQELCKECSQNIGSGFTQDLKLQSGTYTLFSAVGFNAVGDSKASDNSRLISGYLPVCVLPFVGAGRDTINCSGNAVNFTANSYLSDSIVWKSNVRRVTKEYKNGNEEALTLNVQNNKDTTVYEEKIEVFAKKGDILSAPDTVGYKVVPIPQIVISDKNNFCRYTDHKIKGYDAIFGESSTTTQYQWRYNAIRSGKNETSNPSSTNQTLNLSGFENDSLDITLEIKNRYYGESADYNNDKVPCAIDTASFSIRTLNPAATVRVDLDPNPSVGINPAKFEDYNSNPFKLLLKVKADNDDYNLAISTCPPEEIEATILVDNEHFFPIQESGTTFTSADTTNTIIINGKFKDKLDDGSTLYEVKGVPMLGRKLESSVILKNVKFKGKSIDKDKTYIIDTLSKKLVFTSCKTNGERLLFRKSSSFIASIYPNPANENVINLSFENEDKNQKELMKIEIVDMYGISQVLNEAIQVQNGSEYKFQVPREITNGYYLIRITGQYNSDVLPILIMK